MNCEKIWYFSYGSNVLPERFHCYIRGGQLGNQGKMHVGCSLQNLPEKQMAWQIPHRLYFARYSSNWKGAVAFIDPQENKRQSALGVTYLISQQQFIEIVHQENDLEESVAIDLNLLNEKRSIIIPHFKWYDQLLLLGYQNNYPIVTFTSSTPQSDFEKPSEAYLSTIIGGIHQFYSKDKRQLIDYLITKDGIRSYFTEFELGLLIDKVVSSSLLH